VGDLLASLRLARGDHHPGAVMRERLRDRPPDPARRAGDDRDLAGEIEQMHSCPPIRHPRRDPGSMNTVCANTALPCSWVLTFVRMTLVRVSRTPAARSPGCALRRARRPAAAS